MPHRSPRWITGFFGLTLFATISTGGTLYNGIVLPEIWPPQNLIFDRRPMPVPYLENPPEVIPIDVGRQLLVDDFLVEQSSLVRKSHRPVPHPENPILRAEAPWETGSEGFISAYAFSDGVWFDPQDNLFKIWYWAGYDNNVCYAFSKDGIHFVRPQLDVVEPGTNLVLKMHYRDSNTVCLDLEETDPTKRFKMFTVSELDDVRYYFYRHSPDGLRWSEPVEQSSRIGDRSTVFYNPFRKVWVYSIRHKMESTVGGSERMRLYAEDGDFPKGMKWGENGSVFWVGADDRDARHVDHPDFAPQLYNLDAIAYESLMVGLFTLLQGPHKDILAEKNQVKRNQLHIGYSRDGFHWDRPDRQPFIRVDQTPGTWNEGNVQSVGGCFLVVGDLLYIYHTGNTNGLGPQGIGTTGLSFLRRDGFVSRDAGPEGGTLTTRPVTFNGEHLFVNLEAPEGTLQVEVLDQDWRLIPPFTKENCETLRGDKTLMPIHWKGGEDLSALKGKPVRFRFHLSNGALYAFWVSKDETGASQGYVAGGGPGFTGATDTMGQEAYR